MIVRTTGILGNVLVHAQAATLTYAEVGATASTLPTGYRHDRYEATLGVGSETYEQAIVALRHWKMHRTSGFDVFPEDAGLTNGATVLILSRLGALRLVIPCRVVYMLEDDTRFGFAYGTLPGHPECGEEAFEVERRPDDSVVFTITAFSRPHDPLARLGGPITRWVQVRATRSYLRAMTRIVAEN